MPDVFVKGVGMKCTLSVSPLTGCEHTDAALTGNHQQTSYNQHRWVPRVQNMSHAPLVFCLLSLNSAYVVFILFTYLFKDFTSCKTLASIRM